MMRRKTTALFMWIVFKELYCLPVDMHVLEAFKANGWTAKDTTAEELGWASISLLEKQYFVLFNDAIGMIAQFVSQNPTRYDELSKQTEDNEVITFLGKLKKRLEDASKRKKKTQFEIKETNLSSSQ